MQWPENIRRLGSWLLWTGLLATAFLLLKKTVLAPLRVTTTAIEQTELTAQVYGNGTVEAKVVVPVSSTITARVVELLVDQGDTVTVGQLLARLDDDELRQQESLAAAALERLTAGIAVEEATLRKAKSTLALAEKNAERYRKLAAKDLVSRLETEQFDTSCTVARAEVARSQAAIEAARKEQAAGEASLALARSRLADTLITAPQEGVVLSRGLELGATATPGLPIVTLASPETVWVKANVDESQLAGLKVGNEASVSLRSAPGKSFLGRVARLGRQSDRVTEELEVDVTFTPALTDFRLGEQADVLITVGKKRTVTAVLSSALTRREGKSGLWLLAGGRVRFQAVETGIADRRGLTEIIGGPDAQARVVTGPPAAMEKFKDGMPVQGQ